METRTNRYKQCLMKDAGLIQDVKPFLDRLMRSNFRMGEKVYWDVLHKAGEMP